MRRPLAAALALALAACAHPKAAAPAATPEPPQAAAPTAPAPAPAAAAPAPAAPATGAAAKEPEQAPAHVEIPPAGPPPALVVPPQLHFQLSNGLRVRLVEYHRLPIVALRLVLDAGGVHDPKAKPGLASFTAAMMTEGTRRRTSTQISDELGFIGASLGAGAGYDQAALAGSGLSRHLDELLDLFADVLLQPTFPESDFARVKDQRRVALVQQRDEPGAVARKAFGPAYWGDHPYGHWLMGTEESVAATSREDLAAFHRTWWRPQRAELVVVGDVSPAELRAKLERALAPWKGAPPPRVVKRAAPPRGVRTLLLEKQGAPQAFLVLGMPGFERAHPDYVPAEVAFQILGGGSASRLFRNLREDKGYTYGVYAHTDARKLGGASIVGGSVRADVTGKALEAVLAELARMRDEEPSARELDDAKTALILSQPSEFATAGGIAGKIAEEVVYGLPDDYWTRFVEDVRKVTAADVRRIGATYLDPRRLVTVMVADPTSVKGQLAGLPLGKLDVRAAPATPGRPKPGRPAAAPQPGPRAESP